MAGERPDSEKPREGVRSDRVSDSTVICPACGKPIIDLQSAIADRDSGNPLHFDCALERIAKDERLGPGEKLVYSGGGIFSVIEYQGTSETVYVVKRRIQYEKDPQKREWRVQQRAKGL